MKRLINEPERFWRRRGVRDEGRGFEVIQAQALQRNPVQHYPSGGLALEVVDHLALELAMVAAGRASGVLLYADA